jgi:dTDP-4-amino-4,6-dideoxygalactose transaminase
MDTPIPFMDLSRVVKLSDGVLGDWQDCLEQMQFVGGPRVTALEKELGTQLGVAHVVSCANGTDALTLALTAMGVGQGMRVALPNLTFWATYEAIVQVGATPVLVDIDPDDLQMSFSEFARAHDEHRFHAAILPHLYGWASGALAEFRTFSAEREILLLEDGAQSFGVTVEGASIFRGATMSTTSFYPAKVIGGAMDGGAVMTNSEHLAEKVRSLANHGRSAHYSYQYAGMNSRMGGLQAAYLLRMLTHAEEIVRNRRLAASAYRDLLHAAPVRLYGPPRGIVENGYLNVLTSGAWLGAPLAEEMRRRGVGTGRTYPESLDTQPAATMAIRCGALPHSRAFCERVLNLPLFYGITATECAGSVSALLEILQ